MKIIYKLCLIFIASFCVIVGMFFSIVLGKPTFDDTYQSVIQRKYSHLKETNERKIVIVGGSSAGFGIDAPYLEEKTGYKVVNMGLHAGFGNLFNTEIIKTNINEGDIVVLAYEYSLSSDSFKALGDIELISTGIDNHIEIYSQLPLRAYKEILGNIMNYAKKKYTYVPSSSGVYSSLAFDEKGNMNFKRDKYIINDYRSKIDIYGEITKNQLSVTENNLDYLKKLKAWIENNGASVYFSAPPILNDAIHANKNDLENYKSQIEESGIQFISNPEDYIFDQEFMYDTIYHCNSKGERKRTELLLSDLKPYLNIE